MIDSTRINVREVASHYDDLDAFYRSIWGNHVHHGLWWTGRETVAQATLNLVDLLVERLAPAPGARLIDVGCGYGETARVISQRLGADVTGLTISRRQYDFARTVAVDRNPPRYLCRDWMDNQLPSAGADAVYAIESSEHMPDFARFFTECARVLRPGGRLAICAWLQGDRGPDWTQTHLLQSLCDEGRMRLGSRAEYEVHLAAAGFRLVSFDDLSARVARTWTICLGRAVRRVFSDRAFRRYLLSRESANREFAGTLLRIRLAFATGAMKYGLFVAEKIE